MSDRAVAFHEAGHAAAAIWLKVPVRSATIKSEDGVLGYVELGGAPATVKEWVDDQGCGSMWSPVPARIRDWFERRAMIALAGEVAQQKATGTTWGSEGLMDHGAYGSVRVAGDRHEATALVERISAGEDELGAYLVWLEARTRSVLSFGPVWAIVEALAQALAEHRHLAAPVVRQLASAAKRGWLDLQLSSSRSTAAGAAKSVSVAKAVASGGSE